MWRVSAHILSVQTPVGVQCWFPSLCCVLEDRNLSTPVELTCCGTFQRTPEYLFFGMTEGFPCFFLGCKANARV